MLSVERWRHWILWREVTPWPSVRFPGRVNTCFKRYPWSKMLALHSVTPFAFLPQLPGKFQDPRVRTTPRSKPATESLAARVLGCAMAQVGVAGLSQRRPRLELGSVHMGFVVYKMALGLAFLRVYLGGGLPVSFYCGSPYSHIIWFMNSKTSGGRNYIHDVFISFSGSICWSQIATGCRISHNHTIYT
jgi:hypothetical protein